MLLEGTAQLSEIQFWNVLDDILCSILLLNSIQF